mgnify:FL=1
MAYNPQNPNGQATMANSEPVVIASDQSAVPISGTITANLSATDNAVLDAIEADTTTLAGAVSGTEMQVDVLTMPTVTINSPAVTNAGTFVVQENGAALTALQLIDDTVATLGTTTYTEAASKGLIMGAVRRDADTTLVDTTNEITPLQVDANGRLKVEAFSGETLPLSLTTTTITGTVAVTQSGTWDEVGINDSGNSITIDNSTLAVVGGGTEATAMRVTIASDSTGVLSVDDNGSTLSVDDGGGSLTVDGTVAISGTVTVGSHAVTNAGTFAVQVDGSALTSLQLIDDTVFVAGTDTYTEAASKGQLLLAVRRDADTTLVNTTNEFGPLQMDANGYLKVEVFSGGQNIPVSAASGAFASGSIASGAIASGAIASGAIAAGAITAGNTSIATTEDTARAAGEHLVKIGLSRLDTPVANANVSTDGDYTNFIADNFGKLWVSGTAQEDVAHVAGEGVTANGVRRLDTPATSAGTSGDWATMDASAEGALWVTTTPTTTGGCTIFRTLDLDETEEDVKTSAGNVYGYYFYNAATSARYLKFYNATAATVSVGTTTPVLTFPLPAGSAGHIAFPFPVGFATAICVAATTGLADADTGAPAANDVILNVYYK